MAGVRQDENGQWWVDFRWHGRRIRRCVDDAGQTLEGREHAERLHRALLHRLETGEGIAPPRRGPRPQDPSLVDLLGDTYSVGEACLVYQELSARKASYLDIERSLRLWIELFGPMPIDELSPIDVEMALERRAAASSNSTANRDLAYLRAAIRKAVAAGKAQRDPTAAVQRLQEPPHRRRWLRPPEGVSLWEHLTGPQDRRIVLVVVNTGLRRGNACALEWAWVDWQNAMIEIPRTKSGHALTVPLNSEALQALREQHAETGHSRWVWLGVRGGPLDARWWWRSRLRPALLAAGLITQEEADSGRMPSFRTHDLRHTFGSLATAAGVHMQATQQLLGHSSVQVTERYSHLDQAQLRAASEAVAWNPSPAPSPEKLPETVADTIRESGSWGAGVWRIAGQEPPGNCPNNCPP